MQLIYTKKTNSLSGILIEKHLNDIVNLYEQGLSLSKISKKFFINYQALKKLFKDNNIKIRKGSSYARKYNINEHYFDIIDTEEKAYILGFIYADGNNLFKLNRISIQLSQRDEDILKKISNIFYNKNIIKYRKKKNSKGAVFTYAVLNLFSKHMSQKLADLGVVERKSHSITFPNWLNKDLYRHFIRGLIDGDGWIRLPNNNRDSPSVGLICTRSVNDFLQNYYLSELKIKTYLSKAYKQDKDIMCEILVKNYKQCKIFLDWLYEDCNIYLQRKYDLYLNFLNKYKDLRDQNK
jgi:hypothetical protein